MWYRPRSAASAARADATRMREALAAAHKTGSEIIVYPNAAHGFHADYRPSYNAEAAKDAKVRAEKVAESTGSSIGSVRTARMGVLQITPADSNEVSDSGMNDTSSLEKDITAVVNVGFEIN